MLSDTDRQKIEGYLGKKWGIYMDAGHPYTNVNPYLDTGVPEIAKNRIGGTSGAPTFYTCCCHRLSHLVWAWSCTQLVEYQFDYRTG
jgi:hypothetical protein